MSARLLPLAAVALSALCATAVARQPDEGARLDDLFVAAQARDVDTDLRAQEPVTRTADRAARAAVGGPVIDAGWLSRTAAAASVPEPALRAYARAQLTAPPACGVGWTTLAGIGYVESHHGTLGGRSLLADGHSSSPILGPALDGRGDFAAIRSTPASKAVHGDPVWDHAVGPMQFLPSTWQRWGTDGDGDGRADPLDLDDAAAAAAGYLCAGGGDLRTGSGWERAVLAYNHSGEYVDDVYAAASSYAARAGH